MLAKEDRTCNRVKCRIVNIFELMKVQGITKETFPDLVSLLTLFCAHPANLRQSGKHKHQFFTKPGKVSLVIPCRMNLYYVQESRNL